MMINYCLVRHSYSYYNMLSKFIAKLWVKPYIPLLIVNQSLDQQKTDILLDQLKQVNYTHTKAIGMVVEVDNHMPVQLDKILEYLSKVRREHKLKIYGFCQTNVSLESYYLLSAADQIYTQPTTIFQLQQGMKSFSAQALLRAIGIQKRVCKSDPKVIGNSLDSFTNTPSSRFLNMKHTEIACRIYEESRLNRRKLKGIELWGQAPQTMLGQDAVTQQYADKIGCYYQILRNQYPDVELVHFKPKQKMATRTLELLMASPIILIIFLFKVLLKYSIIMYIWLSHKKKPAS